MATGDYMFVQQGTINGSTSWIETGTAVNFNVTITPANAYLGDIYSNNGFNFTVVATETSGTVLLLNGPNGSTLVGPTLTKVSGSGASTITFSAFTTYTNNNLTIGVDNIVYSQFSGAGTYTAGTGLTLTGTQFSLTIPVTVAHGGTSAITFTAGYLKSPGGTGAFTTVSSIPNTDISGLGSMSTQNSNTVAITGGTINGTTIGASSATTATFTNVRVTGISSTATPSQNLTGNATLGSGTATVTITTEADANYRITLTGNTNEVFYVTNKTTTNFVINSSNGSSTASVDWMLLR
jgi:hypothetical protein